MWLKLVVLTCCLISLTASSSKCGSSSSSIECSSSSSWNYERYSMDVIPLPPGVEVSILHSPSYDCRVRKLYFADLFGSLIFAYSEETNEVSYTSIPGYAPVSFIIPTRNNPKQFVIGNNNSAYLMTWNGMTGVTPVVLAKLFSVEDGTDHRLNQAIAGPNGDLYTGTLSPSLCGAPPVNGFYRYSHITGMVQAIPGQFKTTNSLGFDGRSNTLYHLDGCQQQLISYKMNPKSGNLYLPRPILTNFGVPSDVAPVGLAVNRRGHIFVDTYNKGLLSIIDPKTQTILNQIQLPTEGGTSLAWGGGCKLNRLYVLTAPLKADILTGTPTGETYPPPAGSILVYHGLGRGLGTNKPFINHGLNKNCTVSC